MIGKKKKSHAPPPVSLTPALSLAGAKTGVKLNEQNARVWEGEVYHKE